MRIILSSKLVGTVHYTNVNAHRGFGMSIQSTSIVLLLRILPVNCKGLYCRDNMESLVCTIVTLLKGSLPWKGCTAGTVKHTKNRIREEAKLDCKTLRRLTQGIWGIC